MTHLLSGAGRLEPLGGRLALVLDQHRVAALLSGPDLVAAQVCGNLVEQGVGVRLGALVLADSVSPFMVWFHAACASVIRSSTSLLPWKAGPTASVSRLTMRCSARPVARADAMSARMSTISTPARTRTWRLAGACRTLSRRPHAAPPLARSGTVTSPADAPLSDTRGVGRGALLQAALVEAGAGRAPDLLLAAQAGHHPRGATTP